MIYWQMAPSVTPVSKSTCYGEMPCKLVRLTEHTVGENVFCFEHPRRLNFAKLEWNVIKAIICRRAGKFRRLFMCVQLKKKIVTSRG